MQTCPTLERLVVDLHTERERIIELRKKLNVATSNLIQTRSRMKRLQEEKSVLSHEIMKRDTEIKKLRGY